MKMIINGFSHFRQPEDYLGKDPNSFLSVPLVVNPGGLSKGLSDLILWSLLVNLVLPLLLNPQQYTETPCWFARNI